MTIPYTFAGATTAIPLAQLDANFASPITLGNVAMTLSNTYNSIGNLTLTNVTISSASGLAANTVAYANASGALAGSANMVFDGTTITSAFSGPHNGTVGATTASTGAFTTLSASSTVSGAGFSNYLASPPAIGGTAPSTGKFTTITGTLDASISGLTVGKGGGAVATNTAVGVSALAQNTTASNNTAVGYQAGYSITTATGFTGVGQRAGTNTTGAYNSFFGDQSGVTNVGGTNNTAIGWGAGSSTTSASYNTTLGYLSGASLTTGSKNTIIGCYNGNQNGLNIATSSNYIVLSDGDGNPRGIFDGSGRFYVSGTSTDPAGNNVSGFTVGTAASAAVSIQNGSSTALVLGSSANNTYLQAFRNAGNLAGYISVSGTTITYNSVSDYRLKENIKPMSGGLDKINSLKPCIYTWKTNGIDGEGFIAHELQEVIPSAVSGIKDAVDEDGKILPQGIDLSMVVPTLVKAIQEQQTLITDLQTRLAKAGL